MCIRDSYQNVPAFIPVTFEFTVLCAAHGMAITYLIRNKTLPGMPARNPDPVSYTHLTLPTSDLV